MKNIQIHSTNRRVLAIALFSLFIGCASKHDVTLTFDVYVGAEPLEFGKNYHSPNGDGTYSINDFKLYVSNVKLISKNGPNENYSEADSYHLLKFQETNRFSFALNNVPNESYHKIRISIGVDDEGNFSKGYPGDLDPTNQMAWNWTQGYKFLLLEGLYTPESSDQQVPLIFHIGFSENVKDLQFELASSNNFQFAIEINELFKNPEVIDFHTYPRILFNPAHSSMISQNYANSFIRTL